MSVIKIKKATLVEIIKENLINEEFAVRGVTDTVKSWLGPASKAIRGHEFALLQTDPTKLYSLKGTLDPASWSGVHNDVQHIVSLLSLEAFRSYYEESGNAQSAMSKAKNLIIVTSGKRTAAEQADALRIKLQN